MLRQLRPRFSVRAITILVTLVSAYFGAWEATKRYGAKLPAEVYLVDDFGERVFPELGRDLDPESQYDLLLHDPNYSHLSFASDIVSPAPFLLRRHELRNQLSASHRNVYYLWLFGSKFKLPFESKWNDPFEEDRQRILGEDK